MVNEHVKDQMYSQQDQARLDEDDFVYGSDEEMSIFDWECYYERDLTTMWSRLQSYVEETGARSYMLEFSSYTGFVEYCYNSSSKKMCMYPVGK